MIRLIVGGAIISTILVACSESDTTEVLAQAEVASILRGMDEHTAFIQSVEQQLIARCMERAGFDFVPAPLSELHPPGSPFVGQTLSLETARREGYGLTELSYIEEEHAGDSSDLNSEIYRSLSMAEQHRYDDVLWGSPDTVISVEVDDELAVSNSGDGCVADARRTLYGDLTTWLRLEYIALNVLSEASIRVQEDREVITAQAEWSDCMTRSGYAFDEVGDAVNYAVAAYDRLVSQDPGAAFDAEMTVAVADAACRVESEYDHALVAAQHRAAAQSVTERQADLLAAQELRARAAEVARTLLDDGSLGRAS